MSTLAIWDERISRFMHTYMIPTVAAAVMASAWGNKIQSEFSFSDLERMLFNTPTIEASIQPRSNLLDGVEIIIEEWKKPIETPVNQPVHRVEAYQSELDELVQAAGEELKDPALIDSYGQRLSKTTAFQDYIRLAHKSTGLDEDLISAFIATESGGDRYATSTSGAGGLMQFMPKTARYKGLEVSPNIDERYIPSKNIVTGSKYASDLIKRYGVTRGIASYHHGPTDVNDLVKEHGEAKYFDFLPQVTKNYVTRILQICALSKHPEAFGVEIIHQRLDSEILEEGYIHIVKKGETFNGIARKEGLTRQDLRYANPLKDYSLIFPGDPLVVPARNQDNSLKITTASNS